MVINLERDKSNDCLLHPAHHLRSRLRRVGDRSSLRTYPPSTNILSPPSFWSNRENYFDFGDSEMARGPLILDSPPETYLYMRRHQYPVRRSCIDQSPVQHTSPKSFPPCATRPRKPTSSSHTNIIPIEIEDTVPSKSFSEDTTKENANEDCVEIADDEPSSFGGNVLINLGRKSLFQIKAELQQKEDDNDVIISSPHEELTLSGNFSITPTKQVPSGIARCKDMLIGGANKLPPAPDEDVLVMDDVTSSSLGVNHYDPNKDLTHCQGSSTIDDEVEVNGAPDYPIYIALKKKLAKECRQIDFIRGDGNCFFRTISKQLYGSERYHLTIRNLIVDLIATNKDKFSQFVDGGDVQDHVERMCQEQSWATTCEIYAAGTLLQRDIFMLTPDHLNLTYSWLLFQPIFQCDSQESGIASHPCYLTMCNTNGNHYDRIVPEHGGCNCFLPHPKLEGISYSVDLTEGS